MVARGGEKTVDCEYCHRRVPQSKAVVQYKPYLGGVKSGRRYYKPMQKLYLCFHCAKRRHVLK